MENAVNVVFNGFHNSLLGMLCASGSMKCYSANCFAAFMMEKKPRGCLPHLTTPSFCGKRSPFKLLFRTLSIKYIERITWRCIWDFCLGLPKKYV